MSHLWDTVRRCRFEPTLVVGVGRWGFHPGGFFVGGREGGGHMDELVIGDHDPVVLTMRGHCWVECECGWIGPSAYTEGRALTAHGEHVKAVS